MNSTQTNINKYLVSLETNIKAKTEHGHRESIMALIKAVIPGSECVNEPKGQGIDIVVKMGEVPIGYMETKDIGKSLNQAEKSEQLKRYREAIPNMILTDYLNFRLYREGDLVSKVCIAKIVDGKFTITNTAVEDLENLISTFASYKGATIKSPAELAEKMAKQARALAKEIESQLSVGTSLETNGEYEAFKEFLLPKITHKEFADMYAQTITYGMFAARMVNSTSETFTFKEASELISTTTPFLTEFFQRIANKNSNDSLTAIIDGLALTFRASNMNEIMVGYGQETATEDPFIHFYEDFLKEYNQETKKKRGVYYTPAPVVNFIIRAVDEILQNNFGFADGIADSRKNGSGKYEVQILDPATGTGTFLAEIVNKIHNKYYADKGGAWEDYVKDDLLPRLNGFEILMAAYAMAHIKLSMILPEGTFDEGRRLNVFLANTIGDEVNPEARTLPMTEWLSEEGIQATDVHEEKPIMVVVGNPPYASSSMNKGKKINSLLDEYRKSLEERNPRIQDDYIKFIRYGHNLINKTGHGVLAYISNNSFLTGITHRQMRKSLMEDFDEIYVVDLHGNSNIKETAPDGSKDENVFDIQVGTSINIFVKNKESYEGLAKVHHYDLYGKRDKKYEFLNENDLSSVEFQELMPAEPHYFFVSKDLSSISEYTDKHAFFSLKDIFITCSSGIKTANDKITISFNDEEVNNVLQDMENLTSAEIEYKYPSSNDSPDWEAKIAKEDIQDSKPLVADILYRPFDARKTLYTGKASGFMNRPRHNTSKHLLKKHNTSLIFQRSLSKNTFGSIYVSEYLVDLHTTGAGSYFAPLYLYPEPDQLSMDDTSEPQNLRTSEPQNLRTSEPQNLRTSEPQNLRTSERTPNLSEGIISKIETDLRLHFTSEKEAIPDTFTPMDVLDYIYAILHSPSYRETYAEMLKIDFPRVPYPTDVQKFRELCEVGAELRELHLMKTKLDNLNITYPKSSGINEVDKVSYKGGDVFINSNRRFTGIPETAWNFYIGGYRPAQKWLKDRAGRKLTSNDINHYIQIIEILTKTDELTKTIDTIQSFTKTS